jgi:DNA polymerase-3 subunit epsilon
MEQIDLTVSPTPEQAHRITGWLARSGYRIIRPLMERNTYCEDVRPDKLIRVAILDTETTGLDQAKDRIIELGIVIVEICPKTGVAYRIVETFNELEDPEFAIPEESVRVHGITDAMVKGLRIDDAQVDALLSRVDLVVAHNARFDRIFAERRFPGFAGKPWACSFLQVPWNGEGIGSAKLEFLAYHFGFHFAGHRASNDCRALLEVLQNPLPASGQLGMLKLLENAQANEINLSALSSPFESKDALKARGYRWNADKKVWATTVQPDKLAGEVVWLKDSVYKGKSFKLEQEEVNAMNRFSARRGDANVVSYS